MQSRWISPLFTVAALLTVGLSAGSFLIHPEQKRQPFVPPEAIELSTSDAQLVLKQTAKFCEGPVSPALQTYLPPGGASIPVLIYHRVTDVDPPSREVISTARFKEQMQLLKAQGYATITVSQLTEYMQGKLKVPEKTVALTFDDGWKNNIEAAALLAELDMSGTFYIISGFFTNLAYVNEEEVQALARNPRFEIGSHTHSHFIKWADKMDTLDLCTVAKETAASKIILERITKKKIQSIAWPYGYNVPGGIHVAELLGYTSTTHVNRDSRNIPGQSPLFIRRLNIDGSCPIEIFTEMLQTGELKECSP